jgi:hypothetical protein
MSFDFKLLEGLVKTYGAPLYGTSPVKVLTQVSPADYEIIDGNTLAVTDGDLTAYIPIRRSVVEAGITEGQVFTIGQFEATRDAEGEYNGQAWSVSKGAIKVFAY